jgi:polyhydroxybutyrate depolymerase
VDKSIDDVAFAKALVADVEKTACIDTKRVYAVGFSMGGGMTHYIACHAADVFAAAAPTAFDLLGTSSAITTGNVADCKPTRPISLLSFRGTGDTLVYYAGGDSNVVTGMSIHFLGAEATWKQWAQIDGCTDTPAYAATPSSATYNCAYYKQCQGGVQVGVCINTSGHAYATAAGAQTGWTFLKQYTLP